MIFWTDIKRIGINKFIINRTWLSFSSISIEGNLLVHMLLISTSTLHETFKGAKMEVLSNKMKWCRLS